MKKSGLILLSLLLVLPIVNALEFSPAGLYEYYVSNYMLLDFLVFLAIFVSITGPTLEHHFKDNSNFLTAVLSIALAISLVFLETKYNYYLFTIAPLAIGVLILAGVVRLFGYLKNKKKINTFFIVLLIALILFAIFVFYPQIQYYPPWPQIFSVALVLLVLLLGVLIIVYIKRLFTR